MLALGIFSGCLVSLDRLQASTFDYADPANFSTLNTSTTASFSVGSIPFTATRLTSFASTNGLTLGREAITFPSTNPSNPPWIAGTRDMFRLRFNDTSNTTPDGSVTIQYDFSSALPVGSYLVFADFDVKELLKIQAYDSSNSLIPFASLSFARENGRDPGGASLTTPTWTSEVGYSGVLSYGNIPSFSGSDPVVTVQSSIPISRLIYESDNDPYNNVNNNDLYFNFSVPTSSVPEIDPAGTCSVLALIGGALGILERRRLKVS
jgi:hypothetical protein